MSKGIWVNNVIGVIHLVHSCIWIWFWKLL